MMFVKTSAALEFHDLSSFEAEIAIMAQRASLR